jgi:hypothetical protein
MIEKSTHFQGRFVPVEIFVHDQDPLGPFDAADQ